MLQSHLGKAGHLGSTSGSSKQKETFKSKMEPSMTRVREVLESKDTPTSDDITAIRDAISTMERTFREAGGDEQFMPIFTVIGALQIWGRGAADIVFNALIIAQSLCESVLELSDLGSQYDAARVAEIQAQIRSYVDRIGSMMRGLNNVENFSSQWAIAELRDKSSADKDVVEISLGKAEVLLEVGAAKVAYFIAQVKDEFMNAPILNLLNYPPGVAKELVSSRQFVAEKFKDFAKPIPNLIALRARAHAALVLRTLCAHVLDPIPPGHPTTAYGDTLSELVDRYNKFMAESELDGSENTPMFKPFPQRLSSTLH